MKKYVVLFIIVVLVTTGCGPKLKTIKYVKETKVLLDNEKTPAIQTINNVSIELRVAEYSEIPKFTARVYVSYLPHKSDKLTTEVQEHTIDMFKDYSVFKVSFMNKSRYDLAIAGYRFLFIGPDGSPDYAIDKADERFPDALQIAHNNIMKKYPKTDADKLKKDLFNGYREYMRNLQFINGINREVLSGTNSSGFLIFKVPLSRTTDGKISIREIVETNRQVARTTKTDNYEWRTMLATHYKKTILYDADKYKEDWVTISEWEYLNNYKIPQTYWYNDTTKMWIEGRPPKK